MRADCKTAAACVVVHNAKPCVRACARFIGVPIQGPLARTTTVRAVACARRIAFDETRVNYNAFTFILITSHRRPRRKLAESASVANLARETTTSVSSTTIRAILSRGEPDE